MASTEPLFMKNNDGVTLSSDVQSI